MAGDRDSEDRSIDDELTRRLSALDWPKPPPGLAERSLDEFLRRLDEAEAAKAADVGAQKR